VTLDAYGWKDIKTGCEFLLDYEIQEEEWGNKRKPYRYRWPDDVRDEVLAYPDVPTRFAALNALDAATPVVNLHLRKGDLSLRFFSAISFIGRARDITLQNLKVECFFPGDDATEQFARRLAAMPSAVAV
jgi:hypothetical protein